MNNKVVIKGITQQTELRVRLLRKKGTVRISIRFLNDGKMNEQIGVEIPLEYLNDLIQFLKVVVKKKTIKVEERARPKNKKKAGGKRS